MPLYKNVASQKLAVYAWNTLTAAPKTGDAANITAQISKDWGTPAATNDTNPSELDATDHPGIYLFDLTQAETNADAVLVSAVSATTGVTLEPVLAYTRLGGSLITGSVATDGSNSATSFKTDLTQSVNNYFGTGDGAMLLITSGALAGQVVNITAYNGTTKFVTVDALTGTPADGVTFAIVNR